jgi:hypothetical protein
MEQDSNKEVMKQKLESEKFICPIFLSNKVSTSLIIPQVLAKKYEINQPCHVTLTDTQNGILIRKLIVSD